VSAAETGGREPLLLIHGLGGTRSIWEPVVPLLEAGCNIIGACCGSTPDHIRAFRAAMDQHAGVASA